MHFLCFHGIGSNSETFMRQTAAIRYELGGDHTYDFVNGAVPWEMDKDLSEFMITDEETFAFCNSSSPESCSKAVKDLESYLEAEGPYDGVIAFSMGAAFVLSWMANKTREHKGNNESFQLPFKVGIFFSVAGPLLHYDLSLKGSVTPLGPMSHNELIEIPTVHVLGANDPEKDNALSAIQACTERFRFVFVHERGHEVPTAPENVITIVKLINRAITQADLSA